MSKDLDYRRLIHSPRWVRLRLATLTAHPLCQQCEAEGYVTPATEVHHRHPVEYGINYAEKRRLMYSPANLMAVCHDCHVRLHTEMGRSGKEATRRKVTRQVATVIGRFYDSEPQGQ